MDRSSGPKKTVSAVSQKRDEDAEDLVQSSALDMSLTDLIAPTEAIRPAAELLEPFCVESQAVYELREEVSLLGILEVLKERTQWFRDNMEELTIVELEKEIAGLWAEVGKVLGSIHTLSGTDKQAAWSKLDSILSNIATLCRRLGR